MSIRQITLAIGAVAFGLAAIVLWNTSDKKKGKVDFGVVGNWSSNCIPVSGTIFRSIQSDLSFSIEGHFEKVEKLFTDSACLENVATYKIDGSYTSPKDVLTKEKYLVEFEVSESSLKVVPATLEFFTKLSPCTGLDWKSNSVIDISNLDCSGFRNKSGQIVETTFLISDDGLNFSDNLWLPVSVYLEDGAGVEDHKAVFSRH